jgi:hypothetical protein
MVQGDGSYESTALMNQRLFGLTFVPQVPVLHIVRFLVPSRRAQLAHRRGAVAVAVLDPLSRRLHFLIRTVLQRESDRRYRLLIDYV